MKIESRLVPILREGVEVIRMILYMKLRTFFAQHGAEKELENHSRTKLCGAMVNELFGTTNQEEPFASFVTENHVLINAELECLAANLPEMTIPLTDALRIQSLCDFQEGIDSRNILQKAQLLGILLTDRDLPMPHTFIALVRKMGHSFGLVAPQTSTKSGHMGGKKR